MKLEDARAWFDEIADAEIPLVRVVGVTKFFSGEPVYEFETDSAVRWITEAETALASVLPPGHTLRNRWASIFGPANDGKPHHLSDEGTVRAARATFETARVLLKAGRLSSIVEGIRAESVMELLDQAEIFANQGHSAAAAVTAGGALESHLRTLCVRGSCVPSGHGSIGKYQRALDQLRISGKEILSLVELRLVEGWGALRNDAAHKPGAFTLSPNDVTTMLTNPIRQFVARTQA